MDIHPTPAETTTPTPRTLTAAAPPDLAAARTRARAAWSSGDYAVIGTTLQIVGESIAEAADVRSGERVLDVACGNGNATLAAARRFARTTGIDFVPRLLERARARADAEGLEVDLRDGDAEALPFGDGAFDVVLSTFGVMFAPDQARAGSELLRVCRPGGRIGLASWTPDGFVGQMLRVVGRHVAPPPGLGSPARWGTRDGLDALLGAGAHPLSIAERTYAFRYASPAHFLEVFRSYYGPMHRAFAALPPDGQAALARDLTRLVEEHDAGGGGGTVLPSTYLEAVLERG